MSEEKIVASGGRKRFDLNELESRRSKLKAELRATRIGPNDGFLKRLLVGVLIHLMVQRKLNDEFLVDAHKL
jgi:hypothetical protein